jgi:hypothetical protein
MRRTLLRISLLAAVVAAALALAGSASSMGALVIRGDAFCFFAPNDIPGVDVLFETRGQLVITPNGNFHLTCHGELPAGYSVPHMIIDLPCESPGFPNARGQIVVTASGHVNAVCQASV